MFQPATIAVEILCCNPSGSHGTTCSSKCQQLGSADLEGWLALEGIKFGSSFCFPRFFL